MAVSADDVRHVAELARIGLSEMQISALVRDLNGILGHMEVLSRAETRGVSQSPRDTAEPLRPDVRRPADPPRSIESIAPETRDGFFLVPRLATHEDPGAGGTA